MARVISYIDGFNLYFGIKAKGWKSLYWLNVHALSARLLKPDQTLARTRDFTSRVSAPPDKVRRQNTFLEALQTLPDLDISFGHYLAKSVRCARCGNTWQKNEEKMTDVNIATAMLADAFHDRFDTALLVSADSDLTAPIEAVRQLFPAKRIIIAFPPDRFSVTLRRAAHGFIHIERSHLLAAQFPDQVAKPDGYILHRPVHWR